MAVRVGTPLSNSPPQGGRERTAEALTLLAQISKKPVNSPS